VSTHTHLVRVYLESGHTCDVTIEREERERLDSLLWLKRCNAILFKGDGVKVWFNGSQAPLSVVDVYAYDVRESETS
jgi:hypothetical protein